MLKLTTEIGYDVRAATRADLHLLLEHRLAMIAEVSPYLSYDAVEELREPNRVWLERHFGRDFNAFLAYRVHEIAGSAAVIWFDHPPAPTNPGGTEAYILNVYTEPAWRRRGVARNLMDRILTEARTRGVKRIWLRTSDDGRPLYMQMGFRDSDYLQLRGK